MWGIEFEEANNSMIVIGATFSVKHRDKRDETYRFADGPDVGWLDIFDPNAPEGEEWQRIASGPGDNVQQEIIQRLTDDFGYSWTWVSFLIALTFWGEGQKQGYRQGKYDAQQREARRAALARA